MELNCPICSHDNELEYSDIPRNNGEEGFIDCEVCGANLSFYCYTDVELLSCKAK
jgi:transcription elongation factor Elf1